MTELFINQKLNQLAELDYDPMPENPLEWQDDSIKYFIETRDVVNDLVNNLFDGDDEAYQEEHDKYTNATDLFEGLNKIAKEQDKLIYPVTKYKHSMVHYYLGSGEGWDCGVNGFVLVDLSKVKNDLGISNEKDIVNNVKDTLKEFTNYANGDVFILNVYQLNDKGEKEEDLDCVGGIILDDVNIEGLYNLGYLDGDLKDWQEAQEDKEIIQTRYTAAD